MANGNPRLEVEIGAITSDLKKGLAEAREELKKFSKETGLSGVDVLKKQYNDAKIEALKLSATIKDSLAESLNNAISNSGFVLLYSSFSI